MKTIADVFDDQCRRAPDAPAVVSGTTRLTFVELHRWSAQLSLTMAPHVSPGQRVALLLPIEATFAAALFAATRVGGVIAPLDTASPAQALAAQLAELDAAALVTDAVGIAVAIAATSDLPKPPALVLLHDGEADVIERRAAPATALPSDDSSPLLQLATDSSGHRGARRPLALAGSRRAQSRCARPSASRPAIASSAAVDPSRRCSPPSAQAQRSTRARHAGLATCSG